MLQIYSTVYYYTLKNKIFTLILPKLIMKENHFLLALLYSNVILHTFIFLTNINPFGLVHIKILIEYPMLHMNFVHKMVPHYTFIGISFDTIILKNHSYNLVSVVSCVSLTQSIMTLTFQNPINMLIATHHLLILMNPSLMIHLH